MDRQLLLARIGVVICVPIVIPAVFLCELAREIGQAFVYAWLSVRWEMSDAAYYWRHGKARRT